MLQESAQMGSDPVRQGQNERNRTGNRKPLQFREW
jgi:hypothetical protein